MQVTRRVTDLPVRQQNVGRIGAEGVIRRPKKMADYASLIRLRALAFAQACFEQRGQADKAVSLFMKVARPAARNILLSEQHRRQRLQQILMEGRQATIRTPPQ
jgi:hypothetical protein